jgi:multicomponent Na+:H+ antiporter subunit E
VKIFLLNIVLALVWVALLEQYTVINFFAGFVLGYCMLWVVQPVMSSANYFTKVRRIIGITTLFIKELVLSNLRVAYSVLAPFTTMTPGIVAIPLDIESDAEITLLANMITLTPGTLSLDVSDDRRVLYVHGMHVNDLEQFRRDIKDGFETKVREVFE